MLTSDWLAGLARELLALVLGRVFPALPGNILRLGAAL